ncbi:MAG: glutamate racemase [Coriobacteriales bacterium]|nr:glutamate racemase [Coriobacteriales bacterium]
MNKDAFNGYVGVFDSGVGGISILRGLVRELPHERFVYFGDSAHAPYGEKTPAQVLSLSRAIVDDLVHAGCKAIVIACNTATSAAAEELRAEYAQLPIVGVEPALKPAVLSKRHGRVLVMATPMTVRLRKFQDLMAAWGDEAKVIPVPCTGLAARIEKGDLDNPDVTDLVCELVGEYAGEVDAVVLGCTHYPFVANQIRAVLGDVPFFDSAEGTARQLRRRLEECGLLAPNGQQGCVEFLSSKDTPEELALYRHFFQ